MPPNMSAQVSTESIDVCSVRVATRTVGNDMNAYANDLPTVIDALGLTNTILVGHHSSRAGDVTRHIGRYGTKRVRAACRIEAFDQTREGGSTRRGALLIIIARDFRSATYAVEVR